MYFIKNNTHYLNNFPPNQIILYFCSVLFEGVNELAFQNHHLITINYLLNEIFTR